MHEQYIQAVISRVKDDNRIKAAWLEGSFGHGTADRYSDLDFHFLFAPADIPQFTGDVESWLTPIKPLVLCTLLFGGRLVNALTQSGLRVDIVLHDEETTTIDPAKARVLVDKGNHLLVASTSPDAVPFVNIEQLEQQTKEFWRCIALLPSVVGRNELITGLMGLTVETQLLIDVLLTGYGIVRDRGVKNLNQFLPDDLRNLLEQALSMQSLSTTSLAKAHLGLARIMQDHGRRVAEKHSYPYPELLEKAVLHFVTNELTVLNVSDG